MLDQSCVLEVLNKYGNGVITGGAHSRKEMPAEGETCEMCIMELQSLARFVCTGESLEWGDSPVGTDVIGSVLRALNDAGWSSDEKRTDALLPLAGFTDSDCADGWIPRYVEQTVRQILPIALRYYGLEEEVRRCTNAADAADAADAAARAARAADAADAADATLTLSCRLLLEAVKG